MAYHIYLGTTQLPVAPAKIQLKIGNQNQTVTLINEGEINLLKTPGLSEFSFSVLLPQTSYPFACYPNGFKAAAYYLEKIESLKVSKKSFQFIVSRAAPSGKLLFDTNMTVSLEDYTITEDQSANGRDLMVEIKLKQYREYSLKTAVIKTKKTVAKSTRSSTPAAVKTHKVVSGDCLWNIAKKYYGDPYKWKNIYSENKTLIESTAKKYGRASSSNGHWIYPGTVLRIP